MLELVRCVGRHTIPRVRRALHCNGAVVTVHALLVVDLQVKRGVAEILACLYALRTADALIHLDVVFPVGILNEHPLDGIGRAELILRRRSQLVIVGMKIPEAVPAVAADGIGLHTFHRRGRHHTVG